MVAVFFTAFGLNLIWENLHSVLYLRYRGGEITEFILLRASLADAVIVFILIQILFLIPAFSKRPWLVIFGGVVISIIIELRALETGRWAYGGLMPIIPFLGTGLTPTIQLGLLSYLTYLLVFRLKNKGY